MNKVGMPFQNRNVTGNRAEEVQLSVVQVAGKVSDEEIEVSNLLKLTAACFLVSARVASIIRLNAFYC